MKKRLRKSYNRAYIYNNNQIIALILAFLIYPFGAFLYALFTYHRKESQLIMVLFTSLFSYSMIAENAGLDLYRVIESAKIYAELPFDQVFAVVGGLYGSSDDAGVDIYQDLIAFIITRFTSNGHILMMAYGLIYGWVYILSLKALLSVNKIKNIYTIIILLSFSIIFSMDQVAGVRFATAAYLAFWGIFCYLQTKQIKYIIVVASACLIHFSFIAVLLIFLFYILIKPKNLILYILFFVSFFVGNIFGSYIETLLNFMGDSLESRASLYIGQEQTAQNLVWYVKYREEMMVVYIILFVMVTKLRNIKLIESKLSKQLFGFSLMLLSLSYFTDHIPHAGYRYQFVAVMFFMSYVYVIYRYNYWNKTIRTLSLTALPFFLLQIMYAIRSILSYTPYTLFLGSSPMVLFIKVEETIWQIIKSIF